jgi:hypothetical protein
VLTWQIGEVDDLKELLVVAQHMLGMLHWSDKDILNLISRTVPLTVPMKSLTSTSQSANGKAT